MEEFKRSDFSKNETIAFIYDQIKKRHRVPSHTMENLIPKVSIEGICEETVHFAKISTADGSMVYLEYISSTWIQQNLTGFKFPVRIESIKIYSHGYDWEVSRKKQLFSAKDGVDIPLELLN